MREIKFRAWDEMNKIMHYDVEFIRSGNSANDWIIFKSDKQKLEDKKVLDNPYFQQQIKLMQFTGLKDKNGKEIHEGDVVEYQDQIYTVNYDLCSFYMRGCGTKIFVAEKFGNPGCCTGSNSFCIGVEVVGNIYENSELLKVNDERDQV